MSLAFETLRTGPTDSLSPDIPAISAVQQAMIAALDSGSFAVGLFDPSDRLAYSNAAFRKGWAIRETRGVTFDSMIRNCYNTVEGAIIATDDIETWLAKARQNRRDGQPSRSFEVDLWDGRWMWLTEHRLDEGWLLFLAQDITALKQSERTLKAARDAAVTASLTDPLTQLPNRRHAMQLLEARISRGELFHLALLDIDKFKQINDRCGHTVGDKVLVLLSAVLRKVEARGAFAARLAGDEFLVVSPAGESAPVFMATLEMLLAERIRTPELRNASLVFGLSIGAASFPEHGDSLEQLLMAADAAMYEAKFEGRSTVRFAVKT